MSKAGAGRKVFGTGGKEPLAVRIIKYLMLLLFAYSAVFWGSTGVLAVVKGSFDELTPPVWTICALIGGSAVLIAAGVFSWRRANIIAFIAAAAAAAALLAAAGWFVETARHELEVRAVSNDLLDLDEHYMYRALPVLIGCILAMIPAAADIAARIRNKKKQRRERENAPVRSIID